ncbi:hypothetical protein CKO23_18365 [Thiocystis violacea]|nr:hypothetical protein [Thiocystis violacea]
MEDIRARATAGFELATPRDVMRREDLSTEEKISLLRAWEQDVREEMVAEEENMGGNEAMGETLRDILLTLDALGAPRASSVAPTKQG